VNAAGALLAVATGLSGAPVHYCMTPIGVYWSNGTQTGRIGDDGSNSSWGLSTPSSFQVTAAISGGLDPGTYGVSMTFVDAAGQESGAPPSAFVQVPQGGGILVAAPASPDFSVIEARVYVTTANGNELQFAGACAPGAQTTITAAPRGRRLDTQFMQPLSPLQYPLLRNGRLMGTIGRRVVWSEPLRYGLFDPRKNYAQVSGGDIVMFGAPSTVNFMAYVGTANRVYLLQGDALETATLSVASHVGVVPGSMAMVDAAALNLEGASGWVPVWVDQRGIPYAGAPGAPVQLHKMFAYPIYDTAAAIFDERGGDSRYLVSGRGGKKSPVTFSDTVVATVVDNKV
jgi:hypothetical protein